jgi:hypothetical protein
MDNLITLGPLAGNSVSITGTSTAAQNLGSVLRIVITSTTKTHIRFGASDVGAAVTTDFPLEANQPYTFDVAPGRQYFRAIRASADGTLIWAQVG